MKNITRPVLATDIEHLKQVVDSCDLFPSQYLEGMTSDYLTNEETKDIWLTYIENDTPVAISYCVPERLTEGTYNLLAIGVTEKCRGNGIAKKLIKYLEHILKQRGNRILIIETSSDNAQIAARHVYTKIGYTREATIRDFWSDGIDKLVYWKKL